MWLFFLGALVMGFFWYWHTTRRQTKEHLHQWGKMSLFANELIEALKSEYPKYEVLLNTDEDYTIHCFGSSHDFLVFMSYNPNGVCVRVEFNSMLGNRRKVEKQLLPQELTIDLLKQLMLQVMRA